MGFLDILIDFWGHFCGGPRWSMVSDKCSTVEICRACMKARFFIRHKRNKHCSHSMCNYPHWDVVVPAHPTKAHW